MRGAIGDVGMHWCCGSGYISLEWKVSAKDMKMVQRSMVKTSINLSTREDKPYYTAIRIGNICRSCESIAHVLHSLLYVELKILL
jgi:hypothetical protein